MTLDQAIKKKWYAIDSLNNEDTELKSRLLKLGFHPGEKVMLKRKAPIFCDPLLFQVEGGQIALTKSEAQKVLIRETE